jgi:hypothetical protein
MKTHEIIQEGRAHPVIVVDVQPAYCNNPVCLRIIDFVQAQTGPVLMFVNAEDQGLTEDTVSDVQQWWEEQAGGEWDDKTEQYISAINWDRFTVVDKGYGYFRAWMDSGIDPSAIIRTIRLLYQNRMHDSRQLFGGEDSDTYEAGMQDLLGTSYNPSMLSDPLSVNWTSVVQLRRFNGAYLVGGGREECLREVELLMNAFNIRYRRVDRLVY